MLVDYFQRDLHEMIKLNYKIELSSFGEIKRMKFYNLYWTTKHKGDDVSYTVSELNSFIFQMEMLKARITNKKVGVVLPKHYGTKVEILVNIKKRLGTS